jgi:hypothetical protein
MRDFACFVKRIIRHRDLKAVHAHASQLNADLHVVLFNRSRQDEADFNDRKKFWRPANGAASVEVVTNLRSSRAESLFDKLVYRQLGIKTDS